MDDSEPERKDEKFEEEGARQPVCDATVEVSHKYIILYMQTFFLIALHSHNICIYIHQLFSRYLFYALNILRNRQHTATSKRPGRHKPPHGVGSCGKTDTV